MGRKQGLEERVKREQAAREKEDRRLSKDKEQREKKARQKAEAERREWLQKERARPRLEIPAAHAGEVMYVHKRIYERFMKRKDIQITSIRPVSNGGKNGLCIEYETKSGRGILELNDLGPMPLG